MFLFMPCSDFFPLNKSPASATSVAEYSVLNEKLDNVARSCTRAIHVHPSVRPLYALSEEQQNLRLLQSSKRIA